MSHSLLADDAPSFAWAHLAWPAFPATAGGAERLAILPIFAWSDHALNLPLDAEEVLGSALLKTAVNALAPESPVLVLPPLRYGLAPYPHNFFGLDPDAAHRQLHEIAESVKRAGVQRLVFFSTSPWNEEWLDAGSRDIRAALGLRTFVINLSGLGLDFHPESPDRSKAFATAAHLLDVKPLIETRDARISDTDFRPGNYQYPPALSFNPELDGAALASEAATRLAGLLVEIAAKAFPDAPGFKLVLKTEPPASAVVRSSPFPSAFRDRYLLANTSGELASLRDRSRALVVIPTGAVEQHGHHLPVGVDAILGQAYLAGAFGAMKGDEKIWVGPSITFGKSNEHIGFPGTVTVSAASLRATLTTIVAGLQALGFRRLAILNTHGGNSAGLVYTIRELQSRFGGLSLGMVNRLYKPEQSRQEADYGFHAGEWETSLMLAICPEHVDMSRAVCEFPARVEDPGSLRPENAPAIFSWITSDVSKSGVMGDATVATREKGVYWLKHYTASLAARLRELAER